MKQLRGFIKSIRFKNTFIYQNLTNIDSTSLFFVFICNLSSQLKRKDRRKIIFEVLTQSKILKRLDLAEDFWTQLSVCDPKLKKQVDLYKIESIGKANIVTITANPKEYFEKYHDKNINKRHKG